ncbi:MAG TPA: S26 family signal peptidase, partial [Propionicimonas sp.]
LPRRLLGGALSVGWVLGAVLLGYLIWPSSLGGCTTLTIVSGHSMEPTYYTGDLVVARCGPVEKGDVIVYHPTDVGGARVIHRIVGGDATHGWVVQGDNNTFLDPWTPTQKDILGSAKLHLAGVGKFASILLSPLTWISMLVVALAIVIWPGRPEPDAAPADENEDEAAGPSDEPRAPSDDGDAVGDLVSALGDAP